MNKRNFKVSGQKLTKTRDGEMRAQAIPRTEHVRIMQRRGQAIRYFSLNHPSRRREKKAYKKYAAGGFDVDKRFGHFEMMILRHCVQQEMYYDASY